MNTPSEANPSNNSSKDLREQLASAVWSPSGKYASYVDASIDRIMQLFQAHTEQLIREAEKAFGGCKKCYGKGYATWRHGETYRGRTHNMRTDIKYCACERGQQLEQLQSNKEEGQ